MGHGIIMVISTDKDYRIKDADEAWNYLTYHDYMDYIRIFDESEREIAMKDAEEELLQWFDKDGDGFVLNEEKTIDGGNELYEGLRGLLELRYKLGDWYSSSPLIIHEKNFTGGSTRTLTALIDYVDRDTKYYLVDVLDYHE